jgi:hypothetical protein
VNLITLWRRQVPELEEDYNISKMKGALAPNAFAVRSESRRKC